MSILIKGMAMPKNCKDCGIVCEPYISVDGLMAKWARNESVRDDCPLIELPPHGDLIDRDALIKDGWLNLHKEVMRMGGYAIHELPLKNPTIPVIIEAEVDE